MLSLKMGLTPDKSCSDGSRGAFLTTIDDVIFIDKEKLINYENEEFGKKYNESYHAGKSQPTIQSEKLIVNSEKFAAAQDSSQLDLSFCLTQRLSMSGGSRTVDCLRRVNGILNCTSWRLVSERFATTTSHCFSR